MAAKPPAYDRQASGPGLAGTPEGRRPDPGAAAGGAAEPGKPGTPKRPDPTRYGDWEKGGRAIDF